MPDEPSGVRRISLLLQRLDYLAGRLADHPKYFEAIASDLIDLSPNDVVHYLQALDFYDGNGGGTVEEYIEITEAILGTKA